MAFGITGTDSLAPGETIKPRLQFDSRFGGWKKIERTNTSGTWANEEADLHNPTFLMDLGRIHVGFIKFANPPGFALVPFGAAIPEQPGELNAEGKKAWQPGFRVEVFAPKTLGPQVHVFSANSKTVLNAMDALHQQYLAAPEAKEGKVPVVSITGKQAIESKNKQGGVNKFYAPIMQITGWSSRPAELGGVGAPAAPAATPKSTLPPPTNVKPAAHPMDELNEEELPF